MNPNDFGNLTLVEQCRKIHINDLVQSSRRLFKEWLISNQPELAGIKIQLSTSSTGFGGYRIWFSCPRCTKRVGVLYVSLAGIVGCRVCLDLKYSKSRFKGMAEAQVNNY